jgi:hypothetical protein
MPYRFCRARYCQKLWRLFGRGQWTFRRHQPPCLLRQRRAERPLSHQQISQQPGRSWPSQCLSYGRLLFIAHGCLAFFGKIKTRLQARLGVIFKYLHMQNFRETQKPARWRARGEVELDVCHYFTTPCCKAVLLYTTFRQTHELRAFLRL